MIETHQLHANFPANGPASVRFIKLGEGGAWAARAIEEGLLLFGDPHISHEAAMVGDWDAVRSQYELAGKDKGTTTRYVNELRQFYSLGEDCLWVTIHGGRLYWAFAEQIVSFDADRPDARSRRCISGWRADDLAGSPLHLSNLSSAITRFTGFQGTICKVANAARLVQRIQARPNELVKQVREIERQLVAAVEQLIADLDQDDFELLAAHLATSLGWRLTTAVGGLQPHIDFSATLPALGLKGFFQVKSAAGQKELDRFVSQAGALSPHDRLTFVCHSPRTALKADNHDQVDVWSGSGLAEMVTRQGLHGWVMERLA